MAPSRDSTPNPGNEKAAKPAKLSKGVTKSSRPQRKKSSIIDKAAGAQSMIDLNAQSQEDAQLGGESTYDNIDPHLQPSNNAQQMNGLGEDDNTGLRLPLSHHPNANHGDTNDAPGPNDAHELFNMAQAAFNAAGAGIYPPLPTISHEALPESDFSTPNDTNNTDNAVIGYASTGTDYDPYQVIADVAQAAWDDANSNVTQAQPVIIRPVPHFTDATKLVEDGRADYENEVRTTEGHFLSTLHHRIMVETGMTSYFARKRVAEREVGAFDDVKSDLFKKFPQFEATWSNHPDIQTNPIRIRLFNLFFATLVAQYGNNYANIQALQESSLDDECILEARKWVLDALEELDLENRRWIEASAHLLTERQQHLELPSGRQE